MFKSKNISLIKKWLNSQTALNNRKPNKKNRANIDYQFKTGINDTE